MDTPFHMSQVTRTGLSFVDCSTFLVIIGGSALCCLGAVSFLEEARGHMAEIAHDGRIQPLEVT